MGRGDEHDNHLSLMKPVGIRNNNQPMMEDKGDDANTSTGSGGCVGVVVVVARRVLRAVAVTVAKNQQSTNDGG